MDPLSAVSVLTSDVTSRERCLVTGYYYTSGVQLKATDINNTTVPADFKNILTWPQNCRCCCFCRTTNVAAFPWIYVMLYQDVAIYRHATVKQNLTCYRGPMKDLDIHHHIVGIYKCSFASKTVGYLVYLHVLI